jgi:hypothetical protein
MGGLQQHFGIFPIKCRFVAAPDEQGSYDRGMARQREPASRLQPCACMRTRLSVVNGSARKLLRRSDCRFWKAQPECVLQHVQRERVQARPSWRRRLEKRGGGALRSHVEPQKLKANIPGAADLTDAQFRGELAFFAGLVPDRRLNLEGIQFSPILVESAHFFFHLLRGDVSGHTGLIADDTPSFGLYPVNLNQIQEDGNPFDEEVS